MIQLERRRQALVKKISESETKLELEEEQPAETNDEDDKVDSENYCEAPSEDGPVMYMLDPLHGEE